MELIEQFKKVVFENYANFNGRARRKEYWMFQLSIMVVLCSIMFLSFILAFISETLAGIIGGLLYLGFFGLIIPAYAVAVRRMHDTGNSGWFMFVPVYSFILAITEGEKGTNEYGPDPKGGVEGIEEFGKEELLEN